MTSPSQTGSDVATLKIYATFLKERNQVLSELALASQEMRSVLKIDASAEIQHFLDRRERDCLKYAELCNRQSASDEILLSQAETAACSGKSESAAAALNVLSLYEDAQDLAKEIMTCQADCESILKSRLQATAQALQASAKRRKLDAAYGPAVRHDIPVFMDKQT